MPARDAALDAPAATDSGAITPDPRCVVPDVSGESIAIDPDPPREGAAFRVLVSGPVARTNVEVRICTPLGRRDATFGNVTGSYTWEMNAPAIAAGESQIIFVADPDQTVYSTRRVHVALDMGGVDAGTDVDLCSRAEGSLVDGRFDDALAGLAPPGWQVRDPDAPARCGGDPASHVYLTDPPPGCSGRALAIDARGQWDCYAIQAFTDYSTIFGGRTYRVRAAVRSAGQDNPGAWFFLGVQWLDANDQVFGNEQNPRMEPLNFEWRAFEWDLVAPADARRAVVWLTAHYPGRVDFDSLSMTEL